MTKEKYSYMVLIAGLAKVKKGALESGDEQLAELVDCFHNKIDPNMSEDEICDAMMRVFCKFIIKALIEEARKE